MCRDGANIERGLTAIFLTWILLPILVREMHVFQRGVSAGRIFRLPFSRTELLAAQVLGSFVHPVVAGLLALSCFVLETVGFAAGILFVIACVTLSSSASVVLAASVRTRSGLFFAVAALLGVAAVGSRWLPPQLAAPASGGDRISLALLFAWSIAAIAAARGHLGTLLGEPGAVRSRARSTRTLRDLPGVPRPIGIAAAKELRHLGRTADAFLAAGIALAGAAWVLIAEEPAPGLFAAVPVLVVLAQAGAPLNAFGLDRGGIDRYRLLPLRGSEVVASKNLAFGTLLLIQSSPLVVTSAWRFGLLEATALVVGLLAYTLPPRLSATSARFTPPRLRTASAGESPPSSSGFSRCSPRCMRAPFRAREASSKLPSTS
jgi:hypothetical protein